VTPGVLGIICFAVVIISIIIMGIGADNCDDGDGVFIFGLILFCGAVLVGIGDIIYVANHPSDPPAARVEQETVQADNSSVEVKVEVKNDPEPKVDKDKVFDSKNPDRWPGNDAPQAEQNKFWNHWAQELVDDANIACKDGVQVVVNGTVTVDDDNHSVTTNSMTMYPRIHQDGKPFTCKEGKDPQQEMSQ
jgi:hypothetical protein